MKASNDNFAGEAEFLLLKANEILSKHTQVYGPLSILLKGDPSLTSQELEITMSISAKNP